MTGTDASVEFGREIQAARKRQGWTQAQLASRIPCKANRVGAMETGARPPQHDHVLRMREIFDDFEFLLASARWQTGGDIGRVLDAIDGRAAAAMCLGHEIAEMEAVLEEARAELLRQPDDADAETAHRVAQNLLDIRTACNTMLVAMAREYGLSARRMVDEHKRRVVGKGYVHKKSRRLGTAA